MRNQGTASRPPTAEGWLAHTCFSRCGSSHRPCPNAADLQNRSALLAHDWSDAVVRGGSLLEWYIHFGITARRGCIDSGHDPFDVAAQGGPLLIADNHKRDLPAFQVLLETYVLVSRQQKLKTRRLSSRYQFAVKKLVPSAFNGFNHHMALERVPERG